MGTHTHGVRVRVRARVRVGVRVRVRVRARAREGSDRELDICVCMCSYVCVCMYTCACMCVCVCVYGCEVSVYARVGGMVAHGLTCHEHSTCRTREKALCRASVSFCRLTNVRATCHASVGQLRYCRASRATVGILCRSVEPGLKSQPGASSTPDVTWVV